MDMELCDGDDDRLEILWMWMTSPCLPRLRLLLPTVQRKTVLAGPLSSLALLAMEITDIRLVAISLCAILSLSLSLSIFIFSLLSLCVPYTTVMAAVFVFIHRMFTMRSLFW